MSLVSVYKFLTKWVDKSQVLMLLGFRLYIAKVFFMSGLTKIKSMDTTLMLFQYEYAVPHIPYQLAAYSSTFVELVFPILLIVGLAGRFSATGLFVLNYVAAISYPDISPGGMNDHFYWGALLLVLVMHGPGKLSIDALLQKRFFSQA